MATSEGTSDCHTEWVEDLAGQAQELLNTPLYRDPLSSPTLAPKAEKLWARTRLPPRDLRERKREKWKLRAGRLTAQKSSLTRRRRTRSLGCLRGS